MVVVAVVDDASVLVAVWPGKRSQWSSWSGRPMGVLVMVVS
jgi:hypothetical protein